MPIHTSLFSSDNLFDRIARAVCQAGCLPRKELYEAWEMAKRVRRVFRGGRIVDLACGHGLLAHIMLVLDQTSPKALAVDTKIPENAAKLSSSMLNIWPHLAPKIQFEQMSIADVDIQPDDVVVSAHACGALTDQVLKKAIDGRARVAVLPCCHNVKTCSTGSLLNWMTPELAIDTSRAFKLQSMGYEILTGTIPENITPKNRLLMGFPQKEPGRMRSTD